MSTLIGLAHEPIFNAVWASIGSFRTKPTMWCAPINTINSITSIDLDNMVAKPTVGHQSTHGGYCGSAVKPIALNMVAEIARDPATPTLPISGIGGISTWRDAAEFIALGAGSVQVCTAAMLNGFRIVEEMKDGLSRWMAEKGYDSIEAFSRRAVPQTTDWKHLDINFKTIAHIDQDLCIKCGRCYIACEDTSHPSIAKLTEQDGASADQRIATFDLGSLDTLAALGVSEQVVGVPKASLPSYLEQYAADRYTDIGGLRSPDMEALAEANPTLIVHTGRQAEWADALGEIAPLFDASVTGEAYLDSVERNVREMASQLAVENAAEEALQTLNSEIERQRETLQDAPTTLVVTHNGGNLMLNQHPVVHEVLGIAALEMPESVTPEVRGERTFTPLSADAIAEIDPEIVLVIDRSAAIGNEPADAEQLRQQWTEAGTDAQLVMLTPALWYLSGGGLHSLALQIEEVASALN